MPTGVEVTVPVPAPALTTVSVCVVSVNVAVTFVASVTVVVQGPVPAHPAPDQPLKTEPIAGVALSWTELLGANWAEQVAPQSMPLGVDLTAPEPLPAKVTVNFGYARKVA